MVKRSRLSKMPVAFTAYSPAVKREMQQRGALTKARYVKKLLQLKKK